MKVLHITQTDSGGAGLCCLRIHQSLLDQGVESKVVVYNKTTDTPEVYQYGSTLILFLDKAISKALESIGIYATRRSKIKLMARVNKGAYYSSPVSPFDVSRCQLIKWADIIHLHWIGSYVDYPTFFKKISKPIIWTQHDENLFCGAAHFVRDVINDNNEEQSCLQLKRKVLNDKKNVSIVFLSHYMYQQFRSDPIVVNKRKVIINNSVDSSKFTIYNKKEMRKLYNIPQDKIVFAFLAYQLFDPRKGLRVLHDTLLQISKSKDVLILAIGGNDDKRVISDLIKNVGRINNTEELSKLLSCADYFAMPSYQEAFAQSPLEAMACGLPVIAFPCSGTQELINESNGVLCSDFTQKALEEGIEQILSRNFDPLTIRKDVCTRFSPSVIVKQYISLYQEVLSELKGEAHD